MTSHGARELAEQLNNLRIEVSKLKNSLNELHKEKESWFEKKKELSKKIIENIQKVRDSKAKRDALTREVKQLKPKRDSMNKTVSSKVSELNKLKDERNKLSKSLEITDSPSRIRQQMDKLEFRIETEPISFEKEKEIMKKIKRLRKEYDAARILNEANKKNRSASDEFRKMKREAYDAHKSVQEKAHESQAAHEDILKISAEIDRLIGEEEDAFKKFLEFKKQFNEMNSQFKIKLKETNSIKDELDKISSEKRDRKKAEVESFLKSKEDAVNEKIKKRQKLTTEDLLVFQERGKE